MTDSISHPARLAGLRALTRVLSDRVFLDQALREVQPAHRAWVHEVVAGSLRWKGRSDWIIDQLALKKKPTGALRKVLEMAIYQLLNQSQVQPAWIVSESVALTRKREGDAASSFVNALLRRVVDQLDSWKNLPFPEMDQSQQSHWASLPEWIWKRLVRDHGIEWARDFASSSLERPKVWIRSRVSMDKTMSGPLADSFCLTEWWPIHESEPYRSGDLFVQDISSQRLISEFCSLVERPTKEHPLRILDLCAAPGGKSAGLAWNGWSVIATDRASAEGGGTSNVQHRFELLESTAARIRSEPKIRVLPREQALGLIATEGAYDAVWIDPPCTGSGVIRRHPEIRWLKREQDLESLMQIQQELVLEAAPLIRVGGYLMYTVCSVLKDELKAPATLLSSSWVSQSPSRFEKIQEWILSGDGDGFSAVLLRRVA